MALLREVVDAALMEVFGVPAQPPWFDLLLADVERAFVVTGVDTPGWEDPHHGQSPSPEEYSRCEDPGRYAIVHARVDAWCQALQARHLATVVHDPAPVPWLGSLRPLEMVARTQRLEPVRAGGLTVVLASTLVDGHVFGLDVGLSQVGQDIVLVDTVPDCGCDACDSGSADLLHALDGCLLAAARGGVLHARSRKSAITRTVDGWQGSGNGQERWLDESARTPARVERWIGAPWW